MQRNILVTGGAGFIGFHLARNLAMDKRNRITIIDNLARGRLDREMNELISKDNVSLLGLDLKKPENLAGIEERFDCVFHLAAMVGVKHCMNRPEEVLLTNALSSMNMIEFIKRSRPGRVLFSSTSEVYASGFDLGIVKIPTPEDTPVAILDPLNPRFSYAVSKIFGEQLFHFSSRSHSFACNTVRFHNIYGPRMGYAHVIPEMIKRAKEGENPFKIFGFDQTRAFCHVDDAVEALKLVMFSDIDGELFHIGNDSEETNIKDLASEILKRVGVKARTEDVPAPKGSVARRCPDISKLRKFTGFTPRVNLEKGLDETCGWYLEDLSKNKAWE